MFCILTMLQSHPEEQLHLQADVHQRFWELSADPPVQAWRRDRREWFIPFWEAQYDLGQHCSCIRIGWCQYKSKSTFFHNWRKSFPNTGVTVSDVRHVLPGAWCTWLHVLPLSGHDHLLWAWLAYILNQSQRLVHTCRMSIIHGLFV